ncbi:glutathione S-transferase [Hymenopellis radicata]|nr:glutathione S-transferase [Hymenopellis radicata]
MAEQITLYTAKTLIYLVLDELALAEVGAQFTRYEIDLGNKPDWYAPKVNPASKVPAIAYGGPIVPADQPSPDSTKLAESLILVELIADLFPASPLLPSSPVERAQARFFIDTFANKFSPAYMGFITRAESKEPLFAAFEALQNLLVQNGGKKFAVNDDFTIADAAVLPFFARFETVLSNDLGAYDEGEGKQLLNTLATDSKYKVFWDYFQRLKARESFKKTYWPVSFLFVFSSCLVF